MYIKIFLNYILGYINIEVEGYFVEKFINMCISKKIFMWNIKKKRNVIAYINIGIKDFRKAVKIAKQNKCRIKIKAKKGLPFLFNRYRKRKIFIVLLVVLFVGVMYLGNYIWNIEIIGNDNVSYEELLSDLNNNGLRQGVLKTKINTKDIINQIRLERDDIAWIGIELKGTNAIVRVVEADKKPEIVNEDEYCNIVATKSGIITKINAINRYTPSKRGRHYR